MSTRRAKRPGTIEPPRWTINTSIEKIIVNTAIKGRPYIKTMIITSYESENSLTIYIGDSNFYCIYCQLLKNKESGIYHTGLLTKAPWDISCSPDKPFEKGIDSIIIIKLVLTYINDKYPDVKELLFTDLSTKDYDDGSSVSLVGMKVFTDGKTWYESHFDVKMDDLHKNLYTGMMDNATEKKSKMSFNKFIGYCDINQLNIPLDELEIQYKSSATWQEFLSFIHDKIGLSKYYSWLSKNNWFDNFVHLVLKFQSLGLQFIFEPKQYDITYNITKNIGGRHITRKNIRR